MSTLLCAETNALIKLDLGEKGGTRRIVFSSVWDSKISQVSFERLSKLAFEYCTLARPDLHSATITYTDVDGDTITISTPNELTEAFEQFIGHLPLPNAPIVLRAKVTFIKEKRGGACVMMSETVERKHCKIDKTVGNVGRKWARLQLVLDSFVTNMTEIVQKPFAPDLLVKRMGDTIEKLSKDMESMRPKKAYEVVNVDVANDMKPSGEGKGRMNFKIMLDLFLTNMTEIVQGEPAPDLLAANMTGAIEKLSENIEAMRPKKMDSVVATDVVEPGWRDCSTPNKRRRNRRTNCGFDRGRNGVNGRKVAKMQYLDSFLMNMTGIAEALNDHSKKKSEVLVGKEMGEMEISDSDGAVGWEAVP